MQPELPADGATAAEAAVTLPDEFGNNIMVDHEVEFMLNGNMGPTFSASMNASAGFGAAISDGAYDMMEVDVIGLGTQGTLKVLFVCYVLSGVRDERDHAALLL